MPDFERRVLGHMGATEARLEENNRRLSEINESIRDLQHSVPTFMTRDGCRLMHKVDEHRDAAADALNAVASTQKDVAALILQSKVPTSRQKFWPTTMAGWAGVTVSILVLLGVMVSGVFLAGNLINLAKAAPVARIEALEHSLSGSLCKPVDTQELIK